MADFVPAADEVHRLQSGSDAECRLFQRVAEQGHYAGRTRPTKTRQGTYAAAPSGVLLASVNSNDPDKVAAMLQQAITRWRELSASERLLGDDLESGFASSRGPARFFPQDGLVLSVNSRDLPRETPPSDWRAGAWNQDYAWFTKPEARQFLPERPTRGARHDLAGPLVLRLARLHLVDNVRGQTRAFDEDDVQQARLTALVTDVEGSIVSLHLEGRTLSSAAGRWPVDDSHDALDPPPQTRGFDAHLLGQAKYDLARQRFVAFEIVALGYRWGGTQYNLRADDLAPAAMGVVFTLAAGRSQERVAPAFFWGYGWD